MAFEAMPTIDRGTHRVWYEVRGPDDAPAVLLIMGLAFSSRAWHTLPERLEHRFRVITFDNAGTGRSTAPWRLHLHQMADDAASVLDAAGADHASVFGISMGGMIAIELALRHSHRLSSLVLGATHGGYWNSHKPSLRTVATLAVATLLPKRFPPETLAGFLTSEEHYTRDPEGFLAWLTRTETADPLTALRQMSAIVRHAAEDRLARIEVPTLILTGDRDLLVPVENSRRLARSIRGARLVEWPGVGHCFPVERPDEVVRALEEFCSVTPHLRAEK
jgi:pimeloyl-ACP methyl ester carboxylesterase